MMKSLGTVVLGAGVIGLVCAIASTANAAYSMYGTGMSVETGTVANGVLHVQCANNLWNSTAGSGSLANTYENTFSGYACDDYAKAWLVTAIYGGSNLNTAKITATVNGHTIASPTVGNLDGVNDTNANVYGSSVAGIWVLGLAIDPSYLHTDGSADVVSVAVTDKTQGATALFDGRSYYQTLVTISQRAGLDSTLDYAFATGAGDIGTSTGYVTSRILNLGGLGGPSFGRADLYAGYLYGDANQKDSLRLNGVSLLGDDVATKNGTASYPADFVHTSLSAGGLLASNNTLKFTVDAADFPAGSSLEGSLRPEFAVVGVSHAVPEPGTVLLLAAGAIALPFFAKSRRRQRSRPSDVSPEE